MTSYKKMALLATKITPKTINYETSIDPKYYDLVQQELIIKRKQLQTLIKHKNLLGNYYEQLVRETIAKFIPNNYSLASGIIVGNNQSSKQIDIIIFDNSQSFPYFNSDNLIVINPDPVKIIIEVKSVITKSSLKMTKDNLNCADKIFVSEQSTVLNKYKKKYLKILFGFTSGWKLSSLEKYAIESNIDLITVLQKNEKFNNNEFKKLIITINYWLLYNKEKLYQVSNGIEREKIGE